MTTIAAGIFTALIAIAVLFQLALALGAPWGSIAMAGRFPGKFPPPMRVAAVVQALVLSAFALVVLTKSGLVLADYRAAAATAIWVVVGISGLSLAMNLITPVRLERMIWAPLGAGLLASSLTVALA